MGVIQRQGTKNSIIGMVGVMIGAFASLTIYPHALKAYGLVRFLIDSSIILAPILILGVNSLPIKFFPQFEDKESRNHGFMSFVLLISTLILIIMAGSFYVFRDFIVHNILRIDSAKTLLLNNSKYLLPLGVLTGLSLILTQYINVFKRIAIPAVFNNLFLKAGTALLIFLIIRGFLSIDSIGPGIIIIYVLVFLALILYLFFLGEIKLSPISFGKIRKLRSEMVDYALFSILGGVGYLVAFRIDSVMVTTLVGESQNGAYNIGLFIGASISIPVTAITSISAPLISGWWKANDIDKIAVLYKKSSINLLVIGIGLFVLILTSLHDLIELFPKNSEFEYLYSIVFYLGAARIIDMAFGVKHQIIMYSDRYRFALYTVLILAVINVLANLFFIKSLNLGMTGAAMATCISFILVNLIYFIYIWVRFKMQPFTVNTLKIGLVGIIVYVAGVLLQPSFHPAINLVLRSVILIIPYVFLVYFLKLSDEINLNIDRILVRLKTIVKL